MSSPYHPQSDGQTEVVNRCLETYLRALSGDLPSQWVKCLPWAEWWYNTCKHSSIGMPPFQAVYGRPLPIIADYIQGNSQVHEIEEWATTRDHILKTIKENLQRAQNRMKQQADRHRRDIEFPVGSYVFVKLHPYRQLSVRPTQNKLSKKYFGPFQIIERIGAVAYKLLLPPEARIHPVFHISLLKSCPNPHNIIHTPLPSSLTVPTNLEDKVELLGGGDDATHNAPAARPSRNIKLPAKYMD